MWHLCFSLLVSTAGVVAGLDARAGLDLFASRSFEHPWDVSWFLELGQSLKLIWRCRSLFLAGRASSRRSNVRKKSQIETGSSFIFSACREHAGEEDQDTGLVGPAHFRVMVTMPTVALRWSGYVLQAFLPAEKGLLTRTAAVYLYRLLSQPCQR